MSKYSKEIRKAMRQLLKHYEKLEHGEVSCLGMCPLCEAVKKEINDAIYVCDNCPWIIETGKQCFKHSRIHPVDYLRDNYECIPKQTLTKWRRRRIRELKEWLKK